MDSGISNLSGASLASQNTWTLAAYRHIARKRLARKADLDIKRVAEKTWDIAPVKQPSRPRRSICPTSWSA